MSVWLVVLGLAAWNAASTSALLLIFSIAKCLCQSGSEWCAPPLPFLLPHGIVWGQVGDVPVHPTPLGLRNAASLENLNPSPMAYLLADRVLTVPSPPPPSALAAKGAVVDNVGGAWSGGLQAGGRGE